MSTPAVRIARRGSIFWALLVGFACGGCTSDSAGDLFGKSRDDSLPGTGGEGSDGTGGAAPSGNGAAPQGGGASGAINMESGGQASSGGTDPGTGGASPSRGGDSSTGGKTPSDGGAGHTATGGRTGTGGSVPVDAGTGGSPTMDAAPDTGGTAAGGMGTGGMGTGGMGMGPPARIRCGQTECNKGGGEICCVHENSMRGGGLVAQCAKDGATCDYTFRCDSDRDCASGEHCCMEYATGANTPNTVCQAKECPASYACTVAADCDRGQTCCGVVDSSGVGIRYGSVKCQASCNAATFCTGPGSMECSQMYSCQQSTTLPPGYQVCR
jgi:hypothetical protein